MDAATTWPEVSRVERLLQPFDVRVLASSPGSLTTMTATPRSIQAPMAERAAAAPITTDRGRPLRSAHRVLPPRNAFRAPRDRSSPARSWPRPGGRRRTVQRSRKTRSPAWCAATPNATAAGSRSYRAEGAAMGLRYAISWPRKSCIQRRRRRACIVHCGATAHFAKFPCERLATISNAAILARIVMRRLGMPHALAREHADPWSEATSVPDSSSFRIDRDDGACRPCGVRRSMCRRRRLQSAPSFVAKTDGTHSGRRCARL